jgi:hypothetical protein
MDMIPSGFRSALRRRKLVVAIGASVALALSGLGIESAAASTRPILALSLNPDRSGAVRLDGSAVRGKIYVFVENSEALEKVDFYLDRRWRTKPPVQTDTNPPFDLAGTAADGAALPYDTTKLADGPHTIRAVLTWSDGTSSRQRGDFTVANKAATVATTATPTTTATAAPSTSTTALATPSPSATPTMSTPTPSPTASAITHLPGQPAIVAFSSSSAVTPFARQGALIIAGRVNYGDQPMKDASAAGATVLIYLDAIIDNRYGRYHDLLNNPSECGPATSRWPGNYQANEWGYLNDFRVGSVLQTKLKCVLEKMVAENPHMGGFFADDLGSRSWYPGFSWNTWGTTNQQSYRAGAIALAQTFHEVAAEHGLMVMVNGTWTAGPLASDGGGYPNMSSHGLGLADGGYIEYHAADQLSFWTAYADGQWATAPGCVGQGKPFMYVQARDATTRDAYNKAGVFSFLSAQSVYDTASAWGPFHATGLPSRVAW